MRAHLRIIVGSLMMLLTGPVAGASAASLSIDVPAQIRPGTNYTITINGSYAASEVTNAYLIALIHYSTDPCADSAQAENQSEPVQFYLRPSASSQDVGIFVVSSPFVRTDQFVANVTGPRHVCAYLYPQQIGPNDTTAPIAAADGTFQVGVPGGSGALSTAGQVGPLHLDRSSAADVAALVGPPDASATDSVGVSPFPRYRALGYLCQSNDGLSVTSVPANGPFCQTVYFINQRTGKLAAFFSSSKAFTGPHGITVGMPTAQVENRTHVHAIEGCLRGIGLGSRRTAASLFAWMSGRRYVTQKLPNGSRS